MLINAFGKISFWCSLLGAFVVLYHYLSRETSFEPLVFAIVELGLVIQVLYVYFAQSVIQLPRYLSSETLDNDWMYHANGKVIYRSIPPFLVAAMVVSMIVWTFVGLFSFALIESLFEVNFENLKDLMSALFILIGAVGAIPTILFNLRTWNYKGLEQFQ